MRRRIEEPDKGRYVVRMWMVDPALMCRRHLLGEHVELHMMAAWLKTGRRVDGWARTNCLQPRAIGSRHRLLVAEMHKRGYQHASPLRQPAVARHQHPTVTVDGAAALNELIRRCKDCRRLKERLQMNVTKAERIAYALRQKTGAVEVESKSRKYRTFQVHSPSEGKMKLYFIGKAGALRTGASPGNSISCERVIPAMLAEFPLDKHEYQASDTVHKCHVCELSDRHDVHKGVKKAQGGMV